LIGHLPTYRIRRQVQATRIAMTLCTIAIAVGCRRCAIVSVCPVKTVIGDYKPSPAKPADKKTKKA
jgi:hypothetical protein